MVMVGWGCLCVEYDNMCNVLFVYAVQHICVFYVSAVQHSRNMFHHQHNHCHINFDFQVRQSVGDFVPSSFATNKTRIQTNTQAETLSRVKTSVTKFINRFRNICKLKLIKYVEIGWCARAANALLRLYPILDNSSSHRTQIQMSDQNKNTTD